MRHPAAFPAWLKRIVFKHCDRITRRKQPGISALETADATTADDDRPDENAQHSEDRRSVMDAMDALTDKQRQVTALYYINGYSQNEIAEFLETSEAVVKSRLHRARQRLKQRLVAMVENTLKENAPDESFTQRVAAAVATYTAKGPAESHIPSPWHDRKIARTRQILHADDEGFAIDVELAKSASAKVRFEAALHFGIRGDRRGLDHVERLLGDQAVRARGAAVRSYAVLIHPGRPGFSLFQPLADSVPDSIDVLIRMLDDPNSRIRCSVLTALRAYVQLGDARIEAAFRRGLDDPKHKVVPMAACHLGIVCPGCSNKPQDHWARNAPSDAADSETS